MRTNNRVPLGIGAAALVSLAAIPATGIANASSSGCTKGPGSSIVCQDISGIGRTVFSSEVALNQTVQVWSGICQYSARWTYYRGGAHTRVAGPQNHCSTWRAWLSWAPGAAQFDNDKNMCGSFRADVTGNSWTPAACLKIKD